MTIARAPERVFVPAPEGLHPAVCVDEVDLGQVETPWGPRHKVELRWQLDAVSPDTGRRFEVRKRYNLTLHEKAALRRDLELWRGRRFTAEELRGFDLERLVGVPCQVQVTHSEPTEDGSRFANVTAVLPAPGGVALRPVDYVRQRDRDRAALPAVDEVPF